MIVAKGYNKALGTQQNNNRAAVAVTFDSDGNISTVPSGVCVLELQEPETGKWAFYDASNSGYLYAASSEKNYLRTERTISNNSKATITIEESTGVATIKFTGSNTNNWLRYNTSALFSCYGATSSQKDVYLYHYINSATGTGEPEISFDKASYVVASNGALPTLNNPHDLSVSYSVTGDVVSVAGDGSVQLTGKTGTATVTASTPQDDTYAAGEASYSLTVFGAPEITPESGEYAKSVDVTISATDAAALWYTTDGSEPTIDNAAAIKETEFPVNIPLSLGEHTIKAITAYDVEGTILSNVETRTYTVSDKEIKVVEISSFSAVNGDIDAVVSYSTSKGGANNDPYLTSGNQIRLYQINGSNSYGGTITISAAEGYKLSSVTIGSSTATSISYTLDDDTNLSSSASLSANGKFTKEGLTNSSITFYCMGTTSSTRLNVNYISVTYVSTATGTTEPELSYSPSSLTIAANGTLTQPVLNKPGNVTIQSYFSDNTSVATVTDEGVIALAGGTGTATITATSQADETYKEGTATYTLTVFGAPEITPESGTYENSVNVVMNATGAGALFYTTDGTDPRDAIDAATKVTAFPYNLPLSAGTHTIKAVTADESLNVFSDVVTRQYTVTRAVPVPGSAAMKYKKVTSEDDIVDGGVYILVCEDEGGALETIVSGDKGTVASVSLTDNMYEGETNGSGLPYEIMLEAQADGTYALYSKQDEGGYICSGGGSTKNLFFRTQKDENAYWNISLTQGYNNVKIVSTTTKTSATSDTYKEIRYNPNNGSPLFRPYSSSTGNTVQLYKKTFDLSVNANTAGYATAYTTFPYVMPTGADGYIVTETAEGQTIKAKQKYPAGAEVPAHAPLLIKNADAGVTLNPVVLGKTVEAYPYAEENLLHGTRLASDGVTTDVDGTGTKTNDYYYYKLSYKLEAGNPVDGSYGFYRGKADGSAFEMKNTLTAYLALPKSSGLVNNLRISIDNEEGTTTGIQANRLPADNMPQSVYTLSGVRVNAEGNRLPKGIYIVNGKKVVIK